MSRKQSFRPGAIDPTEHNRLVHRRKHPPTTRQLFHELNLAMLRFGEAFKPLTRAFKGLSAALTPQPTDTPRKAQL